jgi:ankyrin repeat protein
LHEVRRLLSGLLFGLIFVPAILWYLYFKFDIHLFVINEDSIDMFYRQAYTRLDEPLAWLWLLIPYLLLRLVLLLFRPATPPPHATTALAQAAARGREDTVRTLLEQGSDINAGNRHGQTPLHLAASRGNNGVVKLLLEQGAMVDAVESVSGYTPLHCAVMKGHAELCELLIRYGADPDALTGDLDSPLHLAIEQGRAGVVRVLLKYRARLDVRGKNGLTPLQQAEQLNKGEIVNLINQHLKMAWPYLQMSRS